VYSFTKDDMICVLLEWRERTGVEILTIFDVDADDPDRCSYIMHCGFDVNLNNMGQSRWGRTSVSWNLSEMPDLRTLLEAAEHALGILELPRSDVEILYRGDRKQDCSIKEYVAPEGCRD
jgi:hypothetical protein